MRLSKSLVVSCALHSGAAAALWFAGQDFVAPDIPKPVAIDATILPPPVETPPAPVVQQTITRTADVIQKTTPPSPKPSTKTEATAAAPDVGKGNGASEPANKAAPTEQTKGAPISAPLTDGGFQVQYDVQGSYKDFEGTGGATFTFNRQGATYEAVLSAKASAFKFNATSKGEVRGDTVATTSFKDGGGVRLLGMGKDLTGSQIKINYPERGIIFGGGSGQPTPLAYDAVYDYVSAMVYVQAVLQHKQGRVQSLSVPIVKKNAIGVAQVSFAAREDVSTYMGSLETIPATIVIPSGSIKSIKMWFAPEVNYRPVQIELELNKGRVKLIARKVT